ASAVLDDLVAVLEDRPHEQAVVRIVLDDCDRFHSLRSRCTSSAGRAASISPATYMRSSLHVSSPSSARASISCTMSRSRSSPRLPALDLIACAARAASRALALA